MSEPKECVDVAELAGGINASRLTALVFFRRRLIRRFWPRDAEAKKMRGWAGVNKMGPLELPLFD